MCVCLYVYVYNPINCLEQSYNVNINIINIIIYFFKLKKLKLRKDKWLFQGHQDTFIKLGLLWPY